MMLTIDTLYWTIESFLASSDEMAFQFTHDIDRTSTSREHINSKMASSSTIKQQDEISRECTTAKTNSQHLDSEIIRHPVFTGRHHQDDDLTPEQMMFDDDDDIRSQKRIQKSDGSKQKTGRRNGTKKAGVKKIASVKKKLHLITSQHDATSAHVHNTDNNRVHIVFVKNSYAFIIQKPWIVVVVPRLSLLEISS